MLAQPLIHLLEKLLKLHKSLYQIAQEKTEILKKGDIDALNSFMKNEQSHIKAIQVIEKERAQIMQKLLPKKQAPSLQDCLPLFAEKDQEKMKELQLTLTEQLLELKSINDLNQQLLEQSMQFVSLNLDLLFPESPTNYSKEEEQETQIVPYSIQKLKKRRETK